MPCSLATALLSAAAAVAGAAGASDEGCWDGGFGPSYCCRGPGGRAECWDALHSFERCCAGFLSESLPFPDLLAARAGRGPLSPDVAGCYYLSYFNVIINNNYLFFFFLLVVHTYIYIYIYIVCVCRG